MPGEAPGVKSKEPTRVIGLGKFLEIKSVKVKIWIGSILLD